MTVQLEKLPDLRDRVVVVGSSVRKNLPILSAHLQALDWQILPPHTRIVPVFVGDFTAEQADAEVYLREWATARGGEVLRGSPSAVGDFSDVGNTHNWSLQASRRVGANKDRVIRRALELKADFLWLIDSDLIPDPYTLAQLLADEKPIVTGVYWTKWARPKENVRVWGAPQVWLLPAYQLSGRGMDESEFRTKLVNRELTRVWGWGACTLMSRQVLQSGLNFAPHPDAPQDGLNAWEDRQLCWKAERMHIEGWSDSFNDIGHVYDLEQDVPKIPDWLSWLGREHPTKALLGDLVSLTLDALEPVPTPRGLTLIGKQFVRGRLGQIPVMPEIEETLLQLVRGESRTIPVHFPVNHPLAYFRGRRRLIRVTLQDAKSNRAPFGLEDEFVFGKGGTAMDKTLLTERQIAAVA